MMKQNLKHTTKLDMKRKIDLIESKPNKISTVKNKALLKSEVLAELKALQLKYSALKIENKQNLEIITNLEIKVKELKEHGTLNVKSFPNLESVSVQTDTILSCLKCDYQVDDIYEFDAHRWTEHNDDEDEEMEVIDNDIEVHKVEKCADDFKCNFCDKHFKNKRDLMKHNKMEHRERLANCWRYASGNCQFGDDYCWFNHFISDVEQEPIVIKCSWCDEVFKTQSDFLKHKKRNHKQFVPKCRNSYNGKCRYGDELCWFEHESSEGEKEKTNVYMQEVFEKIFGMIEKITERVVLVENEEKEEDDK